jgi:hypothetical protein
MTPLAAPAALDAYFLEARSKLLDLAAIFDRLDRGSGAVSGDPRFQKLRQALALVGDASLGRAEKVQELFSLPYDSTWNIPQPQSHQN